MFGDRILILAPHPDDEAVGCSAAILRARALGAHVLVYFMTEGVQEVRSLWPWHRGRREQWVLRRLDESREAADWLGFEVVGEERIPARTLKDRLARSIERARALVRKLSIDVVWAPAYEGGHQDHDAASFVADRLVDLCRVFEFSEYNYMGSRVRSHEFASPNGTEILLVLDERERLMKERALELYASERSNLRHVRIDQEAFRPIPHHDYTRPPHAGRTFYQRFQWVPWHPRIDRCSPADVSRAIGYRPS
jgi:LmbE family N-acetylglucosaminyl deacetylase